MSTSDIGLTDAELTSIRNDIEQLLPDTCTIQQLTESQNDIGEPIRTYSTRAADVSCRVDPESGFDSFEYLGGFQDLLKYTGRFILTLPHDQTIERSDRVVVNGETFEIVEVDDSKSWKASVRCVLQLVSP